MNNNKKSTTTTSSSTSTSTVYGTFGLFGHVALRRNQHAKYGSFGKLDRAAIKRSQQAQREEAILESATETRFNTVMSRRGG